VKKSDGDSAMKDIKVLFIVTLAKLISVQHNFNVC